ncbi:MAG: hypothetical protein DA328_10080 [Nitrososphaeraceae archaeon]|nr:hypothetical protein [Nitrososphaeraceae archaeon]
MNKQKIKIDNAVSWTVHLYHNVGFKKVLQDDITRINLAIDVSLEIVGLKNSKTNRALVISAILYKLFIKQEQEIIL